MVLRALADLFVVHEIPATHLTPAGAATRDHTIPVVTSVSVNSDHLSLDVIGLKVNAYVFLSLSTEKHSWTKSSICTTLLSLAMKANAWVQGFLVTCQALQVHV